MYTHTRCLYLLVSYVVIIIYILEMLFELQAVDVTVYKRSNRDLQILQTWLAAVLVTLVAIN